MGEIVSRTYSAYCPLREDEREIRIDYRVILDRNERRVSFEKGFFCCEDSDECPYPNGCPLYLTVPDEPF